MPEPRKPDQEVTLYFSPKGKSEWFKRGNQPDGWTLDDSEAKAAAANKIEQEEAARKKEIDDAVQAELARREAEQTGQTKATVLPGDGDGTLKGSDPDSPLSEEEAKELADLQSELDELDAEEKAE